MSKNSTICQRSGWRKAGAGFWGLQRRARGLGSTSESYFPGDGEGDCRKMSNEPRKRCCQVRNQNARKHGRRTAQAQRQRKLASATVEALQHLLVAEGMVPRSEGRIRPCPIRPDQMALLIKAEPELAALVRAAGVYLPDVIRWRD
jgi:hypothetical protein